MLGTLLVAPEGINGTLAGSASDRHRCACWHCSAEATGLPRAVVKFSTAADARPFDKLKVRLKREIITFNQPQANPAKCALVLMSSPAGLECACWPILKCWYWTRAIRYETRIGSFTGAVDPGIGQFSDFAAYVREQLDPARHRKVAMFCTGGVRCEKGLIFHVARRLQPKSSTCRAAS